MPIASCLPPAPCPLHFFSNPDIFHIFVKTIPTVMKKLYFLFLLFLLGFSPRVFASAGSAYDGLAFILVLSGFLLAVTGLLWFIDLTRKRGKEMVRKAWNFIVSRMMMLYWSHRKHHIITQ
jgi:hypothetical protein